MHVVNHDPRGNHPPFNGNGDRPFLNRLNGTTWNGSLSYGNINNEAPDFTTPNEAYWSFVDGFLSYCESKGILVFLFPAYVGYAGGDQGWMQEMVANGATKMQSYGAWIATRYKNQKNLVWMMGGDMGSLQHRAEQCGERTFNRPQECDGTAVRVFQRGVGLGDRSRRTKRDFGASMTLNGVYSWTGDVNNLGRRAYAHSPVEPAFLLEEPYDEEGPDGNGVNASATQPVRRFQWWGWLSTIGGYISGNGYVWPFPAAWRNHLDTQGSRDMGRLNAFMGSIAWYRSGPIRPERDADADHGGRLNREFQRLRDRRGHTGRDASGSLCSARSQRIDHGGHGGDERPDAGALVRSDERGLHDHWDRVTNSRFARFHHPRQQQRGRKGLGSGIFNKSPRPRRPEWIEGARRWWPALKPPAGLRTSSWPHPKI